MGKIISFINARDQIAFNKVKERLQQERLERQAAKPLRKKAKIIPALPGDVIPPEYKDLRSFLQRDGLILLSWAMWENHDGYRLSYKVNWMASCGKASHFSSPLLYDVPDENIKNIMPEGRGDPHWYEGVIGQSWIEAIADVVFLAAPWDLNFRIRPYFVQLLKDAGVTVDFDYKFSLGKAREIKFRQEQEKIAEQMQKLHGVNSAEETQALLYQSEA